MNENGRNIDMYDYTHRVKELFDLLEDQQSKETFWARLRYDLEPSLTNIMNLTNLATGLSDEQKGIVPAWRDTIRKLNSENEMIIIYGTAFYGRTVADSLIYDGLDFYGFVGRNTERYPDGIAGKPVMSPEWLFEHPSCYVIIAASGDNNHEIKQLLHAHHYPEDHVLSCFAEECFVADSEQYFLFWNHIKTGAFIDGGCFDGGDSTKFAQIMGEDTKIFAFEPDSNKIALCRDSVNKEGLSNFELFEAGLSDASAIVDFTENSSGGSYVISARNMEGAGKKARKIQTVRIDDVVGDQTVGMIKMDIEGSELSALMGAEQTIKRDKPFLAICVYHKPGDILAIMDLCQRFNPEYHFAIRHHGNYCYETVMYACMEQFKFH